MSTDRYFESQLYRSRLGN